MLQYHNKVGQQPVPGSGGPDGVRAHEHEVQLQHTCVCLHVHTHRCRPETWRRRSDGVKASQDISAVQTPCLQVVPGGKRLHVVTHLFRKHLLVPWVQKYQYVL